MFLRDFKYYNGKKELLERKSSLKKKWRGSDTRCLRPIAHMRAPEVYESCSDFRWVPYHGSRKLMSIFVALGS